MLREVCGASRSRPLSLGGFIFCVRPVVEADGGDLSVCPPAAGLVAARAGGRWESELDPPGVGEDAPVSPFRGRKRHHVPRPEEGPCRSHPFGNISRLTVWPMPAVSYAAYLGKTIWPVRAFHSSIRTHDPPPLGYLIFAVALIILITSISVFWNRRPYLLVGWLWYLGTLVPVIGLVQVGSQAIADRYTYLPLIGVFIDGGWGAGISWRQSGRKAIRGFVSAAGAGDPCCPGRPDPDSGRAVERQLHAVQPCPPAYGEKLHGAPHPGRGMVKSGDLAGAERHHREAIRIKPAFKQAYNGLGYLLMIQGKQDEAGAMLEKGAPDLSGLMSRP